MSRILFRLILLLSMTFPFVASGSTTIIGYCEGEVASTSTIGNNSGGKLIEAASMFPASMFDGFENPELLGINIGLASRLNITQISVWVRESLEGDNIFEQTLTKEEGILKGWNRIMGKAVEIPKGKNLYVGYSVSLKGASFPVSAVSTDRPGGLFLNTEGEWKDMSEAGMGVLSIEMIATASNLIPFDLALKQVRLPEAIKIGSTVPLGIKVFNAGADDVTGFSIECEIEGYDPVKYDIEREIKSNEYADIDLQFTSPLTVKSIEVPMKIAITSIKEGEDADFSNNELSVVFSSNRFEFNKKLLIEEFSTERCTYCPRAAVVLHDLIDEPEFENRILAVVHHAGFGNDWLTVPASNSYLWFYDGGAGQTYAPAFMYDRYSFDNLSPVSNATDDYSAIKQRVSERLSKVPMTALEAVGEYDKATSSLNIRIEGEKQSEYKGDRLTIYLAENNIPAKKQAGASDNFIHQHALRDLNEIWGDEIEWDEENSFSIDKSFYIHPEWVKENIQVIAFISEYNPNNYKGCSIDNVTEAAITWNESGIKDLENMQGAFTTEYFTLTGLKVLNPEGGVYIVKRGNRVTKEYIK